MAETPVDPEHALPWQKLAAALSDLVRAPARSDAAGALPDPHEARVQALADALVAGGVIDAGEMARRMETLALHLQGDKDRAHPKARFSNVRPNDIGGLPGGPIDAREGAIEDWEKLAIALGNVLGQRGHANLHERRRAAEDLGDDYHRLGYFERSVQGVANLLVEKGVLTGPELDRKIAALRKAK
jgi:hypothetical protein